MIGPAITVDLHVSNQQRQAKERGSSGDGGKVQA